MNGEILGGKKNQIIQSQDWRPHFAASNGSNNCSNWIFYGYIMVYICIVETQIWNVTNNRKDYTATIRKCCFSLLLDLELKVDINNEWFRCSSRTCLNLLFASPRLFLFALFGGFWCILCILGSLEWVLSMAFGLGQRIIYCGFGWSSVPPLIVQF